MIHREQKIIDMMENEQVYQVFWYTLLIFMFIIHVSNKLTDDFRSRNFQKKNGKVIFYRMRSNDLSVEIIYSKWFVGIV